jgi:DNA-binding PadR family transcriptional regulator
MHHPNERRPNMSVRNGLLALLERQPMYGYQLRQEFEASTGSTWPLNVGQVYTTLTRLERDGLVEIGPDGEEAQRVYSISAAGRDEVRAWFATPVRPEAPPRDELAIKLALAVRTPGIDVRTVIQAQRTATIRALQDYTRAREAAADDLPWLLVADSLIFAAEAEVRWLDHCETRIARFAGPTETPATATRPPATTTRPPAISKEAKA